MAAKKDDFSVKKISPKLGGERGTRNPNGPTSSHDLVEQMEFLYVEVMHAINNPNNSPIPNGTIVDITFGNCKSSTEKLPFGPKRDWNQVFAFDKTKGDVLSVTLKVNVVQPQTNPHVPPTVITVPVGKQNFKLAADIPSRVPPDARIAPIWYTLQNTENGYHMALLMSIWFGTQADEVYSNAWFSDASHVNASCVINTRPKVYLAPRLYYVRLTIVSGHDLISNDGKRPPSVYVRATLAKTSLKTGVSSGSNPSWNQDLIIVASEPLDGTVHFELIDRVDDQHEECIGKLERKVSEMTALKVPGSAPVMFYDIGPPVKVEPAGDTRRFSSRIKMKLATDQAYHVPEECSLYSSDYRAFAKGLWPGVMGKLEIGILGATDLQPMKDSPKKRNAYVVAKYGNKWARTRTMVENSSPKWNEQFSWDIYDKYTVLTLGIYDNQQLVIRTHQVNDAPVGKVRIRLVDLEWDRVYTRSFPILNLGSSGLKKMGEIQLAIRATSNTSFTLGRFPLWPFLTSPFRWLLPKAHYKSPVSHYQMDAIRAQAVELNCLNLARTEPPLRNEVVKDILKPKSKSFSIRRSKANYERLYKTAMWLYSGHAWINANVRYQTDVTPKVITALFLAAFYPLYTYGWIWYLAFWPILICLGLKALQELMNLSVQEYKWYVKGIETPPSPLVLYDLKLSKLDSTSLDELAEEFDSFPTSESDVNVLRMRYDRMRKMGEKVMVLMGDLASQGERLYALWTLCNKNPFHKFCFYSVSFWIVVFVYNSPLWFWYFGFFYFWLRFPWRLNDLPSAIMNFFRRLPTNEHLMF